MNERKQSIGAPEYTLAELAELSGTPGRTIRYYISRGALDGPVKGGRGAFYTEEHLRELQRIKKQQRTGLTLAEIELQTKDTLTTEVKPEHWWMFAVSSDVIVQVRGGISPWRMHKIRAALTRLTAELVQEQEEKEEEK